MSAVTLTPTPEFEQTLDAIGAKIEEWADRLDPCPHLDAAGEPGMVAVATSDRRLCRACAVRWIETRARAGLDACDFCEAPAATVVLHRINATGLSAVVTVCAEHLAAGYVRGQA